MQMTFEKSNVPSELVKNALWCCWNYEERKGKPTKAPKNPKTGGNAQSNNPGTFTDFSTAYAAYQSGKFCGLGIGIFPPFAAVDIDHCIEDGVFSDMAADIIATMHSYTEVSPSGKGVRIFFRIASGFAYDKSTYYINNQKRGLEVYVSGSTQKFCTITGNRLNDYALSDGTDVLPQILEKYMRRNEQSTPAETVTGFLTDYSGTCENVDLIIQRASRSRNAEKFKSLYSGDLSGYQSQSEAEAALCEILAFYSGGDSSLIDEAFRASGLMREKWDRAQSGSTYGAITIENAVNACRKHGGFYNPYFRKTPALPENDVILQRLTELHPETKFTLDDKGISRLFSKVFRNDARFCTTAKDWFCYNGTVWKPDSGGMTAAKLAKAFSDSLLVYGAGLKDERTKNEFLNFVVRYAQYRYRNTLLLDARSEMAFERDELDTDGDLFNCLNGTLNLKTLEFREHSPDDLLSRCSNVIYDQAASPETFVRFIRQIMCEDADKIDYLQKILGYSLTADTALECCWFWFGSTTRNGKSTLAETIAYLMGGTSGYAANAMPETLARKRDKDSRQASGDIARLSSARFLNVSEPPKSMLLDEQLLKQLLGRDRITARFLHEGEFEFIPQFKLHLNCNYLPVVSDLTLFQSNRIHVISFDRHFSESERDFGLKNRLKQPEVISGAFNWLLCGLKRFREEGAEPPECVRLATAQYAHSSDKIAEFLTDALQEETERKYTPAMAYSAYEEWNKENGRGCESKKNFMAELRRRGLVAERAKDDNGSWVRDLVIVPGNGHAETAEIPF